MQWLIQRLLILMGLRRETSCPAVPAKKRTKRGKWVTSEEGGWRWSEDPRDTAEPRKLEM